MDRANTYKHSANGRRQSLEVYTCLLEYILKVSKFRKIIECCPRLSQKRTKLIILITEGAQDNDFCSFFGRIEDAIICFQDLLFVNFTLLLLTYFKIESIQSPHLFPVASYLQIQVHQFNSILRANLPYKTLNP